MKKSRRFWRCHLADLNFEKLKLVKATMVVDKSENLKWWKRKEKQSIVEWTYYRIK